MISIDNGGTFTDVCVTGGERVMHAKSLTTPYDLSACFVDVLKAASLELFGEQDLNRLLAQAEILRYSSTVGTNAIVQKKRLRLGLLVDEVIAVADLATPGPESDLFSLLVDDRVRQLSCPDDVTALEEEVVVAVNQLLAEGANRLVVCLDGPDRVANEKRIKRIILVKYPRHLLGAIPVLFAHELTSDDDAHRRTWTALLNSFLHPQVESFFWNAENILREHRYRKPLRIFHNDGNSGRVAKTVALKTYSSGPRGGLEGARALARHYGWPLTITMDVGGTTTDVGVVRAGEVDTRSHGEIAGITTSFPMCETVSSGTGGSSVFRVEEERVTVGPESVGAMPGPACFARGGTDATITDAYLVMGMFDAGSFLGGKVALDVARAEKAIQEHIAEPLGVDLDTALLAMETAFNNQLAQAIPTEAVSDDTVLLVFGGAGPIGACEVAHRAGIRKVVVPQLAAVFSAFGISFSDIAHEYEVALEGTDAKALEAGFDALLDSAGRDMFSEGFALEGCDVKRFLVTGNPDSPEIVHLNGGGIKDVKVTASGQVAAHLRVVKQIPHPKLEAPELPSPYDAVPGSYRSLLTRSSGRVDVPVFSLGSLKPGHRGSGPAFIEDSYLTCRVESGWSFAIDNNNNIILQDTGGA
jgi:N-methylhydantoinase A/oxoprolinase/acetone carboxylase beta subunit